MVCNTQTLASRPIQFLPYLLISPCPRLLSPTAGCDRVVEGDLVLLNASASEGRGQEQEGGALDGVEGEETVAPASDVVQADSSNLPPVKVRTILPGQHSFKRAICF